MTGRIIIPAARGARHKARRLARANPRVMIEVCDGSGRHHYSARLHGLDTVSTFAFFWDRKSVVRQVVHREYPGPGDVERLRQIQDIVSLMEARPK